MTNRRGWLTAVSGAWLLFALLACTLPGGGDEDGGFPDGAPLADSAVGGDGAAAEDGATPSDGGFDAGSDGGAMAADGGHVLDAGSADAGASDGGVADGGLCGACESTDCVTATCTELGCERVVFPDGDPCTSVTDGICVAGTCVARGCGDGYREPGPTPPREGCDDGNMLDGDACDSSCSPTVLVVASRDGGEDWPSGPASSIGIDGRGEALFVWSSVIDGTGTDEDTVQIHARRYTTVGVEMPTASDPIVIEMGLGVGWDAQPTVAGLSSGGWVVVWSSPTVDGDLAGIAYVLVQPDGTVGAVQQANQHWEFIQHQPRVAALSSGFVVVWTDESGLHAGDLGAAVRARLFNELGSPIGDEFAIATGRAEDEWEPSVASMGDTWLVAWTDGGSSPSHERTIHARRFSGTSPVDTEELVVSGTASASPSAAAGGSSFAVAWTSFADDFDGDVYARSIPRAAPISAATTAIADGAGAEVLAAIAPYGATGFIVAWQDGGERRGGAFAVLDSSALPAESAALASHLTAGLQGDVALASSDTGIWFFWSDAGSAALTGSRAAAAYLLAFP